MDYQTACNLLNLQGGFSLEILKKNYRIQALIHHPDKNHDQLRATRRLQDINAAYEYLKSYLDIQKTSENASEGTSENTSYKSLLEQFIEFNNFKKPIIDIITGLIFDNCQIIHSQLFKNMNKQTLLELYNILLKYKSIFHITDSLLAELVEIINLKTIDDTIVILNPSIDDIFDNNIYKLNYKNQIFYIPLWHTELQYDISGADLIVKCIPDLPKHITINEHNVIHVYLSVKYDSLLDKTEIKFNLGKNIFHIPVKNLYIQKYQSYTFSKLGISKINNDDIFNITNKSDIIVFIDFI